MHLITDPGPNEYLVNVEMTVDPRVKLPTDTMALIAVGKLAWWQVHVVGAWR